jgi:Undecaprenyl-phosphate glucose phosphotransferase
MNKQNPELRPAPLDDARRHMYTSTVIPGLVMAVDIMAIVLSGVAAYVAYVRFNSYVLEYYVFAIGFVAAATLILFNRAELYQISAIMRPVARSDSVLAAVITAFLFFLTIAFSLKASEIYSRIWLYSFAGASFVSVVLARVALYRIFRAMSRRGMIGRTMVVLGSGPQAVRFLERLERVNPYFTSVLGVYDPDARLGSEVAGQPVLGGLDDLIAAARAARVDDVVVALPWNADGQVVQTVERLKELPVNVYISSDLVGFQLAFRPALGHFQQLPLFEVVQRPISGWSSVIKTVEDRVLAFLALVLLSPLLILVAIAIKLDSPGPVFFRQPRLGFNNREFKIYKFRSMYHCEIPEDHVRQASRDDPRVTRVGRFIRRTSIDELPQLLNVLLDGTMSLVGPRPHAVSHNEEFSEQVRGYFARHRVKPGITGWAQVNGFRGETDTVEKIKARVEHDIYYAENWSLLFDLRILLMTVFVVLFQRTAY